MNNKILEQTINKLLDIRLGKQDPVKEDIQEYIPKGIEYTEALDIFQDGKVSVSLDKEVEWCGYCFIKLSRGLGFENNAKVYNVFGNLAVYCEEQDGIYTLSAIKDPRDKLQLISPLNNKPINLRPTDWSFHLVYKEKDYGNVNINSQISS